MGYKIKSNKWTNKTNKNKHRCRQQNGGYEKGKVWGKGKLGKWGQIYANWRKQTLGGKYAVEYTDINCNAVHLKFI